jgi:hypothetical protein
VHKYADLNVDVDAALSSLGIGDFDVVDGGSQIHLSYDCVLNGQ